MKTDAMTTIPFVVSVVEYELYSVYLSTICINIFFVL